MTTFVPTGAGPGLGLATARRFGVAGHTVALIARSPETLAQRLYDMHAERDGFRHHAEPLPDQPQVTS
ncbi:hypothetical protein [Streptomyces sp. NBC_00637]|uniref:hypothetical protein n=1 Tax=Streptomyces sp. NBC_00637 TaxID=2903667 RepID=UPI003864ADB8